VLLAGDALGASVEGSSAAEIEEEFPGGITKYEARPHMGLWNMGPRRAMYDIINIHFYCFIIS
jgi:hypothetical protein